MHILLTGSTGYIGRRILPFLVKEGHKVTCPVRDTRRFDYEDFDEEFLKNVNVVKADLTDAESLNSLPKDIDAAYYFVHSMTHSYDKFTELEQSMVSNFSNYISNTSAKQVIYLSGISNDENLSNHLESRLKTEKYLEKSGVPLTVLKASIIIGSGSSSFEIIRDLVEKLPVMTAPKWINNKCQPIAIRNVLNYLLGVLLNEKTYNHSYEIGGPEQLSFKEVMLKYAKVRNLKRWIITLPILTTGLSSRWLYFVTSTSFNLARSLVDSMQNNTVCKENEIQKVIPQILFTYEESISRAFQKIEQNEVISSWKDTITNTMDEKFLDFVKVPQHGCFKDIRKYSFERDADEVYTNVLSIGGDKGWYYGNWLWGLRGFLDKLVGGVGLRRGRRSPLDLKPGDALDFWRVILVDHTHKRLLLYAEMKLPGEAWLSFRIKNIAGKHELKQEATFRPNGIWGRLYWYSVLPFHFLIFPGMAKNIIKK